MINNMVKELVKCEECGKMVPEHTVDRYGECRACRSNDKGMCVGDLKD